MYIHAFWNEFRVERLMLKKKQEAWLWAWSPGIRSYVIIYALICISLVTPAVVLMEVIWEIILWNEARAEYENTKFLLFVPRNLSPDLCCLSFCSIGQIDYLGINEHHLKLTCCDIMQIRYLTLLWWQILCNSSIEFPHMFRYSVISILLTISTLMHYNIQ